MAAKDPATRSENAADRARRRWATTTDRDARTAATEAARRAGDEAYHRDTPPPGSTIDPELWRTLDPAGRRSERMRELAHRAAAARRRTRLDALRDAA